MATRSPGLRRPSDLVACELHDETAQDLPRVGRAIDELSPTPDSVESEVVSRASKAAGELESKG